MNKKHYWQHLSYDYFELSKLNGDAHEEQKQLKGNSTGRSDM